MRDQRRLALATGVVVAGTALLLRTCLNHSVRQLLWNDRPNRTLAVRISEQLTFLSKLKSQFQRYVLLHSSKGTAVIFVPLRPTLLVLFAGFALYCDERHDSSTEKNRDLLLLGGAWLLLTSSQDQPACDGSSSLGIQNNRSKSPDESSTRTRHTQNHYLLEEASPSATDDKTETIISERRATEFTPQDSSLSSSHSINPDENLNQRVNLKASTTVFRPPPRPSSTTSALPASISALPPPQRYLEIMVHNVSHTDLILGLDADDSTKHYVRPRFSTFDDISKTVLSHLGNDRIVSFPRHVRSMSDERYSILQEPHNGRNEIDNDDESLLAPAGLKLGNLAPIPTMGQDIRIRESDEEELLTDSSLLHKISHVFFPLLATLLPVWQRVMEAREYKRDVKRVLILVTGVGTPRNRQHSVNGNSTAHCADLMEAFLALVDPKLVVVKIHSATNVFRYDENLHFVENELMPILHSYRDAHATGAPYPDEVQKHGKVITDDVVFEDGDAWRSSLHVILSSADGSPARTHAIQASLRPYRPTYFHFWQLKTFWHESKIVEDDIEVHSFETMETLPPKDVDRIEDEQVQLVLKEMRQFYQEMQSCLATNDNDIHRFWLRKTHKPVLAILLVHRKGEVEPHLFRGSNMEVSMPTGSLCAERNAIGSALATFPELKRHDLKMIAVLAVPPANESEQGVPRTFSSASFVEEMDVDRRMIRSRKPSISSEGEASADDWVISPNDTEGTPVRRIHLHSKSKNRPKRTVVIQSSKDINPLPPCGACNEWLKKIAETNPYFKIVTFTDANCNGVYVSPCQT